MRSSLTASPPASGAARPPVRTLEEDWTPGGPARRRSRSRRAHSNFSAVRRPRARGAGTVARSACACRRPAFLVHERRPPAGQRRHPGRRRPLPGRHGPGQPALATVARGLPARDAVPHPVARPRGAVARGDGRGRVDQGVHRLQRPPRDGRRQAAAGRVLRAPGGGRERAQPGARATAAGALHGRPTGPDLHRHRDRGRRAHVALVRGPRGRAAQHRVDARAAARPLGGRGRPRPRAGPPVETQPLSAAALVEHKAVVLKGVRVHVDYDEPYVTWLFARLDALYATSVVVRRLVRIGGKPVGWFVYVHDPGGPGRVLQIASRERDNDFVVEALVSDARERGVTVLAGRLEPGIAEPLRRRWAVLGFDARTLVHAPDQAVLDAVTTGPSLLTRLDGEWW